MLYINNIVKTFSDQYEPILNGVNLRLLPGDFCILVGSNGSGKSTLLKTISGEYAADSGKILLNKEDITSHQVHRRAKQISYISQDITKSTIQDMTILENLVLSYKFDNNRGSRHYKYYKDTLKAKIQHLGIKINIESPMSILSGGQRQIVAAVMAAISEPNLLLLDEHCSALDSKMSETVMKYTADIIQKQNMTALMVTYNLNDAVQYGNRLVKLHHGRIVLDLSGQEKRQITEAKLYSLFHQHLNSTRFGETQ